MYCTAEAEHDSADIGFDGGPFSIVYGTYVIPGTKYHITYHTCVCYGDFHVRKMRCDTFFCFVVGRWGGGREGLNPVLSREIML